MEAHSTIVSVIRPRVKEMARAVGKLDTAGGFVGGWLYSQRKPMNPGRHWHTGPLK